MQATYIIGGAKNNIILLEISCNENVCMNKNKCLLCFNEFLGIEPTSGGIEWDIAASERFQAMVVDQTYQVEIMSDVTMLNKSLPIKVVLHGAINGKHSSVADQLVYLGLAKYV